MKNRRDIIIVVIAVIVIGISIFFSYQLLFPSTGTSNQTANQAGNNNQYLSPKVDNTTYQNVSKLSNYPTPTLENIGKADLFAPVK